MVDLITKKTVKIRWKDKCCNTFMGIKSYSLDNFNGKVTLVIACANCNKNFSVTRKLERRGKEVNGKEKN